MGGGGNNGKRGGHGPRGHVTGRGGARGEGHLNPMGERHIDVSPRGLAI